MLFTIHENKYHHWSLQDLSEAIDWCKYRNSQGICCTIDILGEHAKTEQQADDLLKLYLATIFDLEKNDLDAALALKLSCLGLLTDKSKARERIFKLFQKTDLININIELDMEGSLLVADTLELAIGFADAGFDVTLAFQAYLNRTEVDITTALEHEITVRLVKGAYKGDTSSFTKIQDRFKKLSGLLLESGQHFTVGTHDPELIDWLQSQPEVDQDLVEFGFLFGLANKTKLKLAKEGWAVVEYVPFGSDSKAYVTRRLRYLKNLKRLGRHPAP
jgi:proline dehydrogenase